MSIEPSQSEQIQLFLGECKGVRLLASPDGQILVEILTEDDGNWFVSGKESASFSAYWISDLMQQLSAAQAWMEANCQREVDGYGNIWGFLVPPAAASLTPPAPASAMVERDLRLWMTGLHGGASSEAIACACLGIEPRFGRSSPPHDSDDLGRCLRLIHAIPEARAGVRILAAKDARWGRLETIWDQLTEMGTAMGLLGGGGWHPEINVLIRGALKPEATP